MKMVHKLKSCKVDRLEKGKHLDEKNEFENTADNEYTNQLNCHSKAKDYDRLQVEL